MTSAIKAWHATCEALETQLSAKEDARQRWQDIAEHNIAKRAGLRSDLQALADEIKGHGGDIIAKRIRELLEVWYEL